MVDEIGFVLSNRVVNPLSAMNVQVPEALDCRQEMDRYEPCVIAAQIRDTGLDGVRSLPRERRAKSTFVGNRNKSLMPDIYFHLLLYSGLFP